MQLGLSDLPKSHLRIFVYTGDEDDVVATSDYYSDYAKALEIMIEDGVENDEYAENDEYVAEQESECWLWWYERENWTRSKGKRTEQSMQKIDVTESVLLLRFFLNALIDQVMPSM